MKKRIKRVIYFIANTLCKHLAKTLYTKQQMNNNKNPISRLPISITTNLYKLTLSRYLGHIKVENIAKTRV